MKKILQTALIIGFFFSICRPCLAVCEITPPGEPARIKSEGTPLRKLQRGFLNIALAPLDITAELNKEQHRDTVPPSWVLALGRGGTYAVGRALVGVYEMLTFFIPAPGHYEPILYPEFTWEKLPAQKN
jgi:putative exosortase-associated protein (TIGR04073 family)